MDIKSPWIKAIGPGLIAALTIAVITTGSYSTRPRSTAVAEPEPLRKEVRIGQIDIGPVGAPTQMATLDEGRDGPLFGMPDMEIGPAYDVAATPLAVDGYVRFLEVGAFEARSEAEAMFEALERDVADDMRMGELAIVYAEHATSNKYRVHIGPFREDVTHDDVRRFKEKIGRPSAIIVSAVEERVE